MQSYHLSNDHLSVSISDKGAELQSIVHSVTKLEYMWSGDPIFWGKKSPVLFPIVGGLKNNSYQFNDTRYQLGRHGFARDRRFTVVEQSNDSVLFSLSADAESLLVYPFHFSFLVGYRLEGHTIHVTYKVENTDDNDIFFSVGAHPAFAVPLVEGTVFEDYYLQFNEKEDTGIWPLSPDGLIKEEAMPFFHNNDQIPLRKSLFYGDALVFKSLRSTAISIVSDKHSHGLTLTYSGFPYMGIWSTKDADFVCIEPWCGIADSVNTIGTLETKEGIHQLAAGESFERSWSLNVF
ncbi:MAG TPA: aldose epimerase [Chitinophagaceae bacterium]|nr:aldose epimerase [Chitinophagaceae bacterium]